MPVSDAEAAFIGFILEGISYGIYVVIFALSLTFLIWRRNTKDINWRMLIATGTLFVLCSAHYALEIENMIVTLIQNPGVPPSANETGVLLVADTIFCITDFCADLVLIYRCYLVWGKDYRIIIFPLLVSCAAVSCSMAAVGLLATTDPTAPLAPPAIAPLGTSSFALSLALNFLLTLAILGRMWYIARSPRDGTGSKTLAPGRVHTAMVFMIESGGLFLAAQLVFVVLFALGSPAQDIVMPITLQIYGIAPTMIIVRVGMGLSTEQPTVIMSIPSSARHLSHRPAGVTVSITTDRIHQDDYPMSPYKSEPGSPYSKVGSPHSKIEPAYPWEGVGNAV